MKKKGNIICIVLLIIVLVFFGIYKHNEKKITAVNDSQLEQMRLDYEREAEEEERERLEKEAHFESIREDIPGIVCWGDDMTYGKGGINFSYPFVLENLLLDNGYSLPVFNNGVSGEDSLTVLGRAGAIPYVTNNFKIENHTDINELSIRSSYNGEEVNPLLRKRNPGINPCSIKGVSGTLYGLVASSDLDKVYQFYFARSNTGETVMVSDGTEIVTNGTTYRDYINIVAIGENGGYTSNEVLVDQYLRFVEYLKGSKNGESYLFLGITKGSAEENKELENEMSINFGEHYINLREYLSTNAMKDLGITPTEEDNKMMAEGRVPRSLKFDENTLNDDGYRAVGQLVYKKLTELNYVKK